MKIVNFTLFFISVLSISSFAGTINSSRFGPNNIVLKSFSGTTDGRSAKLAWDFAEMDHEVTCLLERSEDGVVFSAIEKFEIRRGFYGSMNATDKQVNNGLYYYRLQITKPGFIPYISTVISIRITKGDDLVKEYKIENPFRNELTIKGNLGSNPLVVEIADLNGRVRLVKNFEASTNRESISVPSSTIDKGVYVLRIKEEINGVKKIILMKRILKSTE